MELVFLAEAFPRSPGRCLDIGRTRSSARRATERGVDSAGNLKSVMMILLIQLQLLTGFHCKYIALWEREEEKKKNPSHRQKTFALILPPYTACRVLCEDEKWV